MGTAAGEVGTEADVASGDAGTAAGEVGADADGLVEGDIGTAGWISSVSVDEEDAFLAATSRLCLSLSSMNIFWYLRWSLVFYCTAFHRSWKTACASLPCSSFICLKTSAW